mgnify:CR=1 FL=1
MASQKTLEVACPPALAIIDPSEDLACRGTYHHLRSHRRPWKTLFQ